MLGVFFVLLAVLATAFWGLFAYQNLTLMFGLESLSHFLPAEQAFLAVSVVSPVLFIWTLIAWSRARRRLRQMDWNQHTRNQQAALQQEEAFFQPSEDDPYEAATEQQAYATEDLEQDEGQAEPETPLERHRYREGANAARARVAPSIDLPKPIEEEAQDELQDPYGYAGKGERVSSGEGGAPPSVLGAGTSLDDLIREKNEQDAREANKWEIDPEHPFADNVPAAKPEPAKVSLADVIAEEQAAERSIDQQASFSPAPDNRSAVTENGDQADAPVTVAQPIEALQEQSPRATDVTLADAPVTDVKAQPTPDVQQTRPPGPAETTPPVSPSPAAPAAETAEPAPSRVPPPAPAPTPLPADEATQADDLNLDGLKLPPHPFEVQANQPQALSPEKMANLERRVRGELNSIAMDLASVLSAPERYDHAFQHYNGGAEDSFFHLVSQDLVRGQGPQMNQQLKLLGGETMLKSFVEKYQHLLSTAKLSDPSGETTHRLAHSGMGEVCRALLESQKQDGAN